MKYLRMVLAAKEIDGVPDWIQLVPPGRVEPKGWPPFLNDAIARRLVMAAWLKRKNPAVIDYEHQNLKGTEAPAAGWIVDMADRGDGAEGGIWGKVEWTEKAAAYLRAREYRFLSPVIFRRENDNRLSKVDHAALTNDPAIDGMNPLVLKNGGEPPTDEEEAEDMNWLKTRLGLPETATEAEVQAACKTRLGLGKAAVTALGLADGADEAGIATAVAALKAPTLPGKIAKALGLEDGVSVDRAEGAILALKSNTGGPTRQEFETLQARLAGRDAETMVEAALKAGKVTPANQAWALSYAKENPEGFIEYCKNAVPGVALGELAKGGPVQGAGGLTAEAMAVCKQMGGDPKALGAFKTSLEGGEA